MEGTACFIAMQDADKPIRAKAAISGWQHVRTGKTDFSG